MNATGQKFCTSCGQELKKPRNRYHPLKILSKKGFGLTILAEDEDKLGEKCIIKQLSPGLHNPQEQQRTKDLFIRDAKRLQKLGQHPCIPDFLAYFEEGDRLYLVQEYIDGHLLSDEFKAKGLFDEEEIRPVLEEMLGILQFIHKNNFIHRDLKPSNIIRRHIDQKLFLIDFSIGSTLQNAITSFTSFATAAIGSKGYAPQEQLIYGKPNPSSDLYSLGVTAFFLLTGKDPEQLLTSKGYDWTKNWQNYLPQKLSPKLTKILDKLLQPKAGDRYKSANELLTGDWAKYCGKKRGATADDDDEDQNKSPLKIGLASGALIIGALTAIGDMSGGLEVILGVFGQIASTFSGQAEIVVDCPTAADPNYQAATTGSQPSCYADIADLPTGTWFYSGSTTWAAIAEKTHDSIDTLFPNFQLSYRQHPSLPPGSGTGIQMLLDGQISFAHSSRALTDSELSAAQQRGFRLVQSPVAIDGVAVVVHPELPVESLTLEQLRGIYTGQITNWQEINPNIDLFIQTFSPPRQSGSTVFVQKNVLNQKDFVATNRFIDTPTEAIRAVANHPQKAGIYIASARNVVEQCSIKPLAIAAKLGNKAIKPYVEPRLTGEECTADNHNHINVSVFQDGSYPLTRRLFAIVKMDGQVDQQVGEAYKNLLLTREGQQQIQEAGFVPILKVD